MPSFTDTSKYQTKKEKKKPSFTDTSKYKFTDTSKYQEKYMKSDSRLSMKNEDALFEIRIPMVDFIVTGSR